MIGRRSPGRAKSTGVDEHKVDVRRLQLLEGDVDAPQRLIVQ